MSVSSAEPKDKDMGQGLCTNLPKDPFKHAKVKFSLFDPIASSDWQLYNKECNSCYAQALGVVDIGSLSVELSGRIRVRSGHPSCRALQGQNHGVRRGYRGSKEVRQSA